MSAVLRRALIALVLAFGLALMHGGIGQAVACSGMAQMAPEAMPTADELPHGHDADSVVDHSQHREPGDQPVSSHGSDMCMSTPATASGGDSKAGPSVIALTQAAFIGQPQHTPTICRATGREPPAPDLVSVLCVNRR